MLRLALYLWDMRCVEVVEVKLECSCKIRLLSYSQSVRRRPKISISKRKP